MPLIKRQEAGAAGSTAREMRRTAALLDALARAKPSARQKASARAHPEMERIARRFAAINGSLAKGVKAGSVTRAQLRSIGRNFAAIGQALEKSGSTGH
jgi:hypothetical protein